MIEFSLDPKSGVPFYRQIIDQIRYGIAAGKLTVGDQLPTVRALAVQLKVNLNTVNKAYKELEIQNVLETQQGSGTFIGVNTPHISDTERQRKITDICTEFMTVASNYGISCEELIQELEQHTGGSR